MKKQIPDFPNYYILNDGRVFSFPKKRFMKIGENGCVTLSNNSKSRNVLVAKLVAHAFLPRYNFYLNSVLHRDGNIKNNNRHNLEWCHACEKFQHSLYLKQVPYDYRDDRGHLKNPVYYQALTFLANKWSYQDIQALIPVTDKELQEMENGTYIPGYLS